MKFKALVPVVIGLFLMANIACVLTNIDDSSADPAYSVTDDRDKTINFDNPFEYVVTLGLAFTSTTLEIGKESKLILVDTGSKDALPAGSTIPTISTSSYTDVANKIGTIVAEKGIQKDDVLVVMYSYSSSGLTTLAEQGYNNVMGFYPKSYDNVVTYVEKMETLMGADHTKSQEMATFASGVVSKIADYTGEKVKAVYVSYSSSTYKIGNKDSIATSMIEKCGAINAGYDSSKSSSTYAPSEGVGPFLLNKINNDGLKVIFLDGNYTGTAADFVQEQSLTGKDVKVYKLDKTWNSYTPVITDGLNYMSKCLYPSIFGNPDGDDNKAFNYTPIIIGVVAAVVIIGAAFIIIRRH